MKTKLLGVDSSENGREANDRSPRAGGLHHVAFPCPMVSWMQRGRSYLWEHCPR
jgi:hypothetical protein